MLRTKCEMQRKENIYSEDADNNNNKRFQQHESDYMSDSDVSIYEIIIIIV